MQIEKSTKHLKIHEQGYITEILEQFGMENCNSGSTAIYVGSALKKANDEETLCDQKLY